MPLEEYILQLPGFVMEEIRGTHEVIVKVRYEGEVKCVDCGSDQLRSKGVRQRKVRHICYGHRWTYLEFASKKYACLTCGRYFYQRFPGIQPYARSSELFRRETFWQHMSGISQSTLSHQLKLSHASIGRWCQDFLRLEASKQKREVLPRVLGIDEHFFSKKHGYVTTLADLQKHCVYDLVLGRTESNLGAYLRKLKGRDRVQVVVMDLSSTYRSIVRKYFPNAKIVSDRFHVIRLVGQQLLHVWKELDPVGRKHRGLLSLMRRKPQKLSLEQQKNLQKYFQEVPGLEEVYGFIQQLQALLRKKHQTAKQCKKLIPKFLQMIHELQNIPLEPLQRLGKTLESWKEEIVRMWRFTKTNSITEGLHTRMEELQRRAYGFRNFENYRLRVTTLIGYRPLKL